MLGTAGYMSPEQVRGAAVDHRADLFALGAILYELLSRAAARSAASRAPRRWRPSSTNRRPICARPDRPVPPALTRIIERCLEKHPAARFQTASDLAFALETVADGSSLSNAGASVAAAPAARRGWIAWAAAALLLVSLGPLAYQRLRERAPEARPIRFQIPPTVESSGPSNFSVSPDGRHLAFFALGADGLTRIWIRAMDAFEVRPLAGTEVFPLAPPPFWSPDSRFIAFDSGGKLKKIDIAGGPPETLCELPSVAVGGTWNRDGDIVIGNTIGGLFRLRETGGALTPVTALDPARKEEFHLLPTFLPDGRHFIYLRVSPAARESSGTYVGTLDAAPAEQQATRLLPYAVGMTYAPAVDSGSGHLLFLREGTLMAQPFDEKSVGDRRSSGAGHAARRLIQGRRPVRGVGQRPVDLPHRRRRHATRLG